MSNNPHIGSSLDDLLCEEGIFDEVNTVAIKRVLSWQFQEAMAQKSLTKAEMAEQMHTSRASVHRLLNPENASVTLTTLVTAAAAVGKRLSIELIDDEPNINNPSLSEEHACV